MADEVEITETPPNQGATGPEPSEAGASPSHAEPEGNAFSEHPELFVGAAFAGGLALAIVLRRLAR